MPNPMRPCITCGEPRQINVFCVSCYLRSHPLVENIKVMSITSCQKCHRILDQNAFSDITLDKYVQKTLPDKLKLSPDLKKFQIESQIVNDLHDRPHSVDFTIRGRYDEVRVEEKYSVPIDRKRIICDQCRKQRPSYYEAILQVREAGSDQLAKIRKVLASPKFQSVINRHDALKEGGDFYFAKKHAAQQVAKQLRAKLGGTIESSKRIYSRDRQTSKEIYRGTILYKPDK